MRIGEVARTLGTDPPTIRYYEGVGILPAAERSENRYREYGDEDVRRIELVLALRAWTCRSARSGRWPVPASSTAVRRARNSCWR